MESRMLKSEYIKRYKETMFYSLSKIHPEWGKEEVEPLLDKMIIESFNNPVVEMDNNYTGEHKEATLISVFDWALKAKPIIAGNGTFYRNQYQAANPVAQMLDGMLVARNRIKKEMFKLEDDNSEEYMDFDRGQKNEKINVNSYYGASGAPSSAFYSLWSGPATTLTAQNVISTTENTFEAFVADNYDFIDINEFFDWINSFLPNAPVIVDDWLKPIDVKTLYKRLKSKILKLSGNDKDVLRKFVDELDSTDRSLIYYKNNLIQFVKDHRKVRDLYESIFEDTLNLPYLTDTDDWKKIITKHGFNPNDFKTVDEWNKKVNKEYFMDPNDVPSSIKEKVKIFSDYLVNYIYVPYMPFDRVYRLKNFKRKCVTIIDTDSNILALDTWVNYTLNEVLKSDYGRDKMKNVFIAVNTITYVLTEVVGHSLLQYGEYANVPEEFRPRLNMKNEFMFSKLVIGKTKKRYLSKVLLREGNLMLKPKTDIKGFDFVKATTSRESEKFYKYLLDKYIMGDNIDTRGVMKELKGYANKIHDSIKNGEITYLPVTSAKALSAYKDPASEQSVRGMIAWNLLNPDKTIDIPSKPRLLKLKIYSEKDIEPIRYTYPNEYEIIKTKIFHDTTGMFVTEKKDIDKKGNTKINRKERGLVVLCIPTNQKIPEWCNQFIDYSTMIDNILAPFKSVVEILNVQNISVGKSINGTVRKSDKITNIVRF